MSGSQVFSWKERTWKNVLIEDRRGYVDVILVPQKRFEIEYYENRIGINAVAFGYVIVPLKLLSCGEEDAKGVGRPQRGLVQDYIEIWGVKDSVKNKKIEPTLTVNLCFNNCFYFGWLPLLTALAGCVSVFVWKKFRQGKKADAPKFKYKLLKR